MQLMFIRKVSRKNVRYMNKAIIAMLKRIPAKYRQSITFDRSVEKRRA
ncbi:MAG TPA: hypothetical protein PKK43_03085 [Spirochaetota bacterium]|nr:hypothetical protein [Spirochaetota bacterium]